MPLRRVGVRCMLTESSVPENECFEACRLMAGDGESREPCSRSLRIGNDRMERNDRPLFRFGRGDSLATSAAAAGARSVGLGARTYMWLALL